jgi:signal transduction histidine kinase
MRSLILRTIGKANREVSLAVERFFEVRPPLLIQILVALFFMFFGLCVMVLVKNLTDNYYPSITIATSILVTLFSGFFSGIAIAISTELIADYLFTPPIGSILADREDIENLLIVLILSISMSLLVATLRGTIRKTVAAKQEAERASASMEKVLATISHDIRNSLGVSALAVDSMQRFYDKPERLRSLIATALMGLDQTDKMIHDLLDATRSLEGAPISMQFEYCDLCEVVQKAYEELDFIHGEQFRFARPEPIMGLWNPAGIRRALENLGSNAVKYGSKGRPITITLYRNEDNAMISVHNEGNEIQEDDRAKLFDRFYRAKSSEETYTKGWGIGLAVVKDVAEAHGGSVSVESTKEAGTTFSITAPIRTELATNDSRQAA